MPIGAVLARLVAVAALAAALPFAALAASSPPRGVPTSDPAKAQLVAEAGAIVPGQTLWTALHFEIDPGWHVYWRNPGDSGLPTEIAWTLPAGFNAGEIEWPAPERFVVGQIGNYGYADAVDLLVPITAPATLKPGDAAPIEAHATWLVCADICIPGEAKLRLDLPVAAAAPSPDPNVAKRFAAARARLPRPATFDSGFAVAAADLRLSIPAAALAGVANPAVAFYPFTPDAIDAAAAPRQEVRADGIDLVLARATGPTAMLPQTLDGVLVVRPTDGDARAGTAYTISAPQIAGAAPTGSSPSGETAVGWWQALLLAFAGGLILNLMPCVFPILSLKLLGLANSAHREEERRHGIAYAAGVILSFALLGGVLLALRSGGAAIGWGFQLQSPVVVALLAYLLFAMGLSLSGVAEFGASLASGAGSVGGRFAGRSGSSGAFATGVLATIVATPCTAPFMGAALGFALLASAPQALAIFVALGAGLAAPIVLATAIPGVARLLPRPGPWMVWFKQLLAFPLYGTVAWLIWVLTQQVAPGSAFFALLGLVLVAFAVWIYGRTRLSEAGARRVGFGLGAAGLAAALLVAATLAPAEPAPGKTVARGSGLDYEPFSTARLDRLTTERQPIFVNLTAAWCISCLVNERTALDSDAVRRAFADRKIVAMKGDWTRQDPDITAFLQKFGRSGVPLYLLYDRTGTPTILPQLLTETGVLAALAKI